MSESAPLITPREELDNAIEAVTLALFQAGLRVARSFDVENSTCAAPGQPCPHHGTIPCACRLAILTVSDDGPPVALAVHGDGDRTSFSLAEPAQPVNSRLAAVVTQVLASETFLQPNGRPMKHSVYTTKTP